MDGKATVAQRFGRKLVCPKCRADLIVALTQGVEVDCCTQCKGVWVDHIEEKQILQMKPDVFTIDELKRLRKLYRSLGKTDPVRYVPCPVCQQLMHRKNWGSHSGVLVDSCADHGTWYDEHELDKVREFVTLGGVEFEKLRLTERGLNELSSKLTTETARLSQRINYRYAMARLFSLIGL